jgi:hypothetical protein
VHRRNKVVVVKKQEHPLRLNGGETKYKIKPLKKNIA